MTDRLAVRSGYMSGHIAPFRRFYAFLRSLVGEVVQFPPPDAVPRPWGEMVVVAANNGDSSRIFFSF